jgi:DNA-binding helix-hairpin-helix protein with protein kinase domain
VSQLLDDSGRVVTLGREIGRGGEGSVFESRDLRRDTVAKVYHGPLPPDKQDKLRAMARLGNGYLQQISAWPTEVLTRQMGGAVVGFVMARIDGCEPIHNLSSPASRKQIFPTVDYAFLVHVARNVAAAFDAVHAHGHVIGDVNENNFLVGRNGTVKLIDCDSFQIRDGKDHYYCDVGVRLFTPPELQQLISFRGKERTANHDNFGLAVLVFQLLLLGRHPYSGVPLGKNDVPIEDAIAQYRFAYGSDRRNRSVDTPPDAITLPFFPPEIGRALETAFTEVGSRTGRPTAKEWVTQLEALRASLRTCPQASNHKYPSHVSACPWCEREKMGRPAFVAQGGAQTSAAFTTSTSVDVASVWSQIQSLAILPSLPAYSRPQSNAVGRPAPIQGKKLSSYRMKVSAIAVVAFAATFLLPALWILVLLVGGLLLLIITHPVAEYMDSLRAAIDVAKKTFENELDTYNKLVHDPRLTALRDKLQAAKAGIDDLPALYQRLAQDLQASVRDKQLDAFLDRFLISDGDIEGIGPTRISALASFNVETARDITYNAVIRVQGIGDALAKRLIAWRQKIEGRFKFDPSKGVPQQDVNALRVRIANERTQLEQSLRDGALQMQQLHSAALGLRLTVKLRLDTAAVALDQAEADMASAKKA